MKKNERLIQYFDLDLHGRTHARDIKHKLSAPRKLCELLGEFSALRELNKARKQVSARSRQEYRLEDLEEHDDYWVLLINVVDTDAANPVTQKLDGTDKDREVIELGKDRGLESSSHVIVFKNKNIAGKHLCLFEKSSSLPFAKAMSFLNYLCKEAAKHFKPQYAVSHPSGEKGKTINLYCQITFLGHPSDEFKKELEQGVLNDIRITTDMDVVKGYDSNVHTDLISTDIKMNVGRLAVAMSGGNWKHLKKAIGYAESLDSPLVRVAFTDESGAGHSATLSTDTGNLYNADKYIKKRKIQGFAISLRTAFPVIQESIRDKMLETLDNG